MTRNTSIRLEWSGQADMIDNLDRYMALVNQAVDRVAEMFAPVFEEYAKLNARWKDRTSNARQTLNADWRRMTQDVVILWLAHGVEYGIYLEKRWSGRYAIIWPTIESHLAEINRALQGIFS